MGASDRPIVTVAEVRALADGLDREAKHWDIEVGCGEHEDTFMRGCALHLRDYARFLEQADVVGGMSLRDYFAGQAVVGLANSINALGILDRDGVVALGATQAYKWADAMLVARAGADYGSR